jgi:hypothetical protein
MHAQRQDAARKAAVETRGKWSHSYASNALEFALFKNKEMEPTNFHNFFILH